MIIRNMSIDNIDKINAILNTSKLSLTSKGLLLYILEKNDNYDLSIHDLAVETNTRSITIEKCIDELQKFGYINYEIIKKENSLIDGKFIVYDTPQPITIIRFKFKSNLTKTLSKADKNFIKTYLNLDKHRQRDRKISTLLSEMRSEIVNWDNIAEYIINMPYDSFLLTDYWLIISYYLKNKYNFTCTNCGRHFNLASCLNVHHKTYENHGYEHLQSVMDNDLEVLCEDCHKRKHSERAHQEE